MKILAEEAEGLQSQRTRKSVLKQRFLETIGKLHPQYLNNLVAFKDSTNDNVEGENLTESSLRPRHLGN